MRFPDSDTAKSRRGRVLAQLPRCRRSGLQARGPCPFCEAERGHDRPQNLAVHFGKQKWFCHRCRRGGSLTGAFTEPEVVGEADDLPAVFAPPQGYTPLWHEDTIRSLSFRPAIEYAKRRKITRTLAEKARLGATVEGHFAHRLIVPVLPLAGKGDWQGFIARDFTGLAERPYDYPRGMRRGEVLYHGGILALETDEPALCMESFMDTAPHWDRALGFMGKPSHAHVELLLAAKRPLCIVLDGDAWREGEALALRLRFEGKRAGFVRLPAMTDPNDCDPGWLREEARRSIVSP